MSRGEVFIGFDGSGSGDGVVVFDGQTYRFLGYTDDAGAIVGQAHESYYVNAAGRRVEVGEISDYNLRNAWAGGTVSFTVPLRQAVRCAKCAVVLGPAEGEHHCGPCQGASA